MPSRETRPMVWYEYADLSLRVLALTLAVYGASQFAPGRAEAQTQPLPLPVAGGAAPGLSLRMGPAAQAEVRAALGAMDDDMLRLTYARIHATFRQFLGHDDLSVARALVDYAALAQAELGRRSLTVPPGTDSAEDMNLAYELVL